MLLRLKLNGMLELLVCTDDVKVWLNTEILQRSLLRRLM